MDQRRGKLLDAGPGPLPLDSAPSSSLPAVRRGPRAPRVALLLETSTEYGRGLLRGILRYSRLHGPWSIHVSPGHLRQILPHASSWKGSGLIARVGSAEVEQLIHSVHVPCVISRLAESESLLEIEGIGEIRSDCQPIARMAAAHLLEVGFRQFAFCGFTNCWWSTAREKTFFQFARDRGFGCSIHRIARTSWMHRPDWIQRWQREQPLMIRWLKSLPKPVGLMACNDVCGFEVLQACAAGGLRVPDEVAVIGVDNDEMMCELADPPLSSVALDVEHAGYQAAALLDAMMRGRAPNGRSVLVRPTHLAVRLSTDVIVQEDKLVARALQFIRDHARHNLSVNDVREDVGVSRRTLERRFFAALRRTVLEEITRCHLERAKRLLLESDLPCGHVAVEAGFGSLNTFNRAFVRQEGITPQHFRRNAGRATGSRRPPAASG